MTLRNKSLSLGSAATLVGGSAGALLLALTASPASAVGTTYTVDDLSDGVANAADCTTPEPAECSLRDALDAAADGDVIEFASGLSGTITLTNGQLEVRDEVEIRGPGAATVTIDADGASRIFYVCSGSNPATISGLTMTDGIADDGAAIYEESCGGVIVRDVVITGNMASENGGAIYSNAELWVYDSQISTNTAYSYGGGIYAGSAFVMVGSTVSGNSTTQQGAPGGGGIFASGDVDISTSTVDSNSSANCGGGLYVKSGYSSIEIVASTFSNNSSYGCYGGGIDIDGNNNTVMIANTTITGNEALDGATGGGIHIDNYNNVSVIQSTIVGNTSTSTDSYYSGGGIHLNALATITMSGTIVSGNAAVAGAADIGFANQQYPGPIAIAGDDLLVGEVDARITFSGAGIISSTTPGVGALADNGGPTKTMALDPTSAAIDAGGTSVLPFPGDAYDQRGTGYARIVNGLADLGAFEVQPEPEPTTTSTTSTTSTSTTEGEDPIVPEFTG